MTDDAQEAIDREDVSAVVVCAGTDQHAALALAAVEAGRHLYLESHSRPASPKANNSWRRASARE